jgi:hypothetical protein
MILLSNKKQNAFQVNLLFFQGSISPILWCKVQMSASSHSLATEGPVHFYQQNNAQVHHNAQLENTLNFHTVRPFLNTNKFSINLMAQKLPVEC